jgi:hypothetical protein
MHIEYVYQEKCIKQIKTKYKMNYYKWKKNVIETVVAEVYLNIKIQIYFHYEFTTIYL